MYVESSDFVISETNKKYDLVKIDGRDGDITIKTTVLSKYDVGKLLPNESRTQKIILESNGKLTSTGVLDFPSNIAQIKTAYSNPMGRRDVYSIPGNLKYISIPADIYGLDDDYLKGKGANIELDSFWAETVEITKPTGEDKSQNIALIISITAGIAIVGVGAFIIKKRVL